MLYLLFLDKELVDIWGTELHEPDWCVKLISLSWFNWIIGGITFEICVKRLWWYLIVDN